VSEQVEKEKRFTLVRVGIESMVSSYVRRHRLEDLCEERVSQMLAETTNQRSLQAEVK